VVVEPLVVVVVSGLALLLPAAGGGVVVVPSGLVQPLAGVVPSGPVGHPLTLAGGLVVPEGGDWVEGVEVVVAAGGAGLPVGVGAAPGMTMVVVKPLTMLPSPLTGLPWL
jgi:hypothetical protein